MGNHLSQKLTMRYDLREMYSRYPKLVNMCPENLKKKMYTHLKTAILCH